MSLREGGPSNRPGPLPSSSVDEVPLHEHEWAEIATLENQITHRLCVVPRCRAVEDLVQVFVEYDDGHAGGWPHHHYEWVRRTDD